MDKRFNHAWKQLSKKTTTRHPLKLLCKDIDPKMYNILVLINQSGWAWTLYSCAGHNFNDNNYGSSAYLGLFLHKSNVKKLKLLIERSLCVIGSYRLVLTIEENTPYFLRIPNWTRVFVYLHPIDRRWRLDDLNAVQTSFGKLAKQIIQEVPNVK